MEKIKDLIVISDINMTMVLMFIAFFAVALLLLILARSICNRINKSLQEAETISDRAMMAYENTEKLLTRISNVKADIIADIIKDLQDGDHKFKNDKGVNE